MAAPMELWCWKGDWGLPSIDVDCLTVIAYAKFAGAPLKLKKINNPWKSPSGSLPVFKNGEDLVFTSPGRILDYLRQEKFNADYELTAKQSSDVVAFTSLLEEKFIPAMLHSFWMDARNYVDFSRPWYARALPFPLNFFVPGRMQQAAEGRLQYTRGGDHLIDGEMESQIYRDAKECLNLLSGRLGEQDFFFGQSPTTLDAIVFAHIAPVLKAPLPSNQLQNHLKNCNNLVNFCARVTSRYFPSDSEDADHSTFTPSTVDDRQYSTTNKILSAGVAIAAMVAYALLSGLVQIDMSGDDDVPAVPESDINVENFRFQEEEQEDD
ncbi:metaxin-1-like [Branchiostoma floridae]|uniref:Metaxin n=1 Tax=Branchiostoma floridae TaxID=7739 RepID=A0A9J7HTS7_BRAFL|nr:metaxin-1-like [Branchiostoma floridae]